MNKNILLLLTIFIFLLACTNEMPEQEELVIDTNYFPVEKGFFKEYQVRIIDIDSLVAKFDTIDGFIRELNTGYISDAAGDSVMRLERWYKDSLNHKWSTLGVWTTTIKENRAIQMEENIKYVKLIFPLSVNKTWNGNVFNRLDTLQQHAYEIISMDEPESFNEVVFDSVLKVQHIFDESAIEKTDDYEKYAYGIGLVYKQMDNIESQVINGDPIEERARKRVAIFMEIINFGYEE